MPERGDTHFKKLIGGEGMQHIERDVILLKHCGEFTEVEAFEP